MTKEYYHPTQTTGSGRYTSVVPYELVKVSEDMDRAAKIIFRTGNASISMIERYTGWSFSKASQVLDSLTSVGIIGPFLGATPREILISKGTYERIARVAGKSETVELSEVYINQIIRDENEWRRQRRGLSPVEYELVKIDSMDGHAFENWCADLLRKIGFSDVQITQGSGDQGIDVLATKDGIHYAIQCKCYSSDLGNKPIQEVNTGKVIYHCQIGAVMTNRYFTVGGKAAAEATGTLLWDRTWLQAALEQT